MFPLLKNGFRLGSIAFVGWTLIGCSSIQEEKDVLPPPGTATQATQPAPEAKAKESAGSTTMAPLVTGKKPTPAQTIKQAGSKSKTADELVILAERYYSGIGETQDIVKGLSYFIQAANKGNGYACRRLGMEYSDFAFDDKTPRDDKKARAWFEKGAALGDSESMFYLSQFVFEGRGGEKDEARATSLLVQAAQNRSQKAAHRVLKLNKKGTVALSAKDKWDFYQLDKDLHDNITLMN